MTESKEKQINLDLLWLAYLSGQFGRETLEWHKRHTPGFSAFVTKRLMAILGDEAWREGVNTHG